MATLLSYQQQQSIKPISANNETKYTQLAKEVEESILPDLLGVALLQAIQAAPTNAAYKLILDGDTYTDCNGNTVSHKGLRYCLAYFNFVLYIGSSFVTDTFTGFVQKNRPDSESINEGTIRRIQSDNKKIALAEWSKIKDYLIEKQEPLFYYAQSKKIYLPKLRGLRASHDNNAVYYDQKTRQIL